jgi:hypothetical protein
MLRASREEQGYFGEEVVRASTGLQCTGTALAAAVQALVVLLVDRLPRM